MTQKKKTPALILETDQSVVDSISKILSRNSYEIIAATNMEEALDRLKENRYPLVIIGEAEGSDTVFQTMKDIVMASPMTSMILISDLPEKEVDEKAEGYGILGHVKREISSKDLLKLIKSFEAIFSSFAPAGK